MMDYETYMIDNILYEELQSYINSELLRDIKITIDTDRLKSNDAYVRSKGNREGFMEIVMDNIRYNPNIRKFEKLFGYSPIGMIKVTLKRKDDIVLVYKGKRIHIIFNETQDIII